MAAQNNYDPMLDFYKKGMDFLFRQSPVIVLSVIGLWLLWQKTEKLEVQRVSDRLEVRQECAEAIDELRDDLRHCMSQKDTLIKLYSQQAMEMAIIRAAQKRWARVIER